MSSDRLARFSYVYTNKFICPDGWRGREFDAIYLTSKSGEIEINGGSLWCEGAVLDNYGVKQTGQFSFEIMEALPRAPQGKWPVVETSDLMSWDEILFSVGGEGFVSQSASIPLLDLPEMIAERRGQCF